MKKFRLLAGLLGSSALLTPMVSIACTWHFNDENHKVILVDMIISDSAWDVAPSVGQRSVLDWTNKDAVSFSDESFLDLCSKYGIYGVENLSDPQANAEWDSNFNSITIEPTEAGEWQIKFVITLCDPTDPSKPGIQYIISSTVTVTKEEKQGATIQIEDYTDPNYRFNDIEWYQDTVIIGPNYIMDEKTATLEAEFSTPLGEEFDATTDIEVYSGQEKITSGITIQNTETIGDGFKIEIEYDLIQSIKDTQETTPTEWTIKNASSKFDINSISFSVKVANDFYVKLDPNTHSTDLYAQNNYPIGYINITNGLRTGWIKIDVNGDPEGDIEFHLLQHLGREDHYEPPIRSTFAPVPESDAKIEYDTTNGYWTIQIYNCPLASYTSGEDQDTFWVLYGTSSNPLWWSEYKEYDTYATPY